MNSVDLIRNFDYFLNKAKFSSTNIHFTVTFKQIVMFRNELDLFLFLRSL